MKSMRGWRLAAIGALLSSVPVAVACGPAETGTGVDAVTDDFEIQFPTAYSAYDGEHEFKVPFVVKSSKKVKWSAKPADLVDIENNDDGSAMITTKGDGEVEIFAKIGSSTSKAKLTILKATPEDWAIGDARYNNGNILKKRERPDGGWDKAPKGERPPPDPTLSCINCHGEKSTNSRRDKVKHTPMQTAGYSDDELKTIFTKGKKPDGAEMRSNMSEEQWSKIHQWKMEGEQANGILVYLRSLAPVAQGSVDFGGRGSWGGGGKGGGSRDDDKPRETETDSDAGASEN